MMRMNNIQMTTTVPKAKLLDTLRENLKKHAEVVREARDGYVRQAAKALERRLEELRKGRVASLTFSLSPPQDYSEIYLNAIQMLEWNTDESVELAPDEFRQLVQDKWDWTGAFYGSTQSYSKKAWDWMNDNAGGALVPPPEDLPVASPRPE